MSTQEGSLDDGGREMLPANVVRRVRAAVCADHKAGFFLHEMTVKNRVYALMRAELGTGATRKTLLSAGIHGDEPAGVEALCAWLEARSYEKFLQKWTITVLPCLNPWGYEHGLRENHEGFDLNRAFNWPHPPQEVKFVQSVLQRRFDLSLELHTDSESSGYYVYETEKSENNLGHRILDRVRRIVPINLDGTIDGKSADGGVITRHRERKWAPEMPMAIYGLTHETPCLLTFEAGKWPLSVQVQAHLLAIEAALDYCSQG